MTPLTTDKTYQFRILLLENFIPQSTFILTELILVLYFSQFSNFTSHWSKNWICENEKIGCQEALELLLF